MGAIRLRGAAEHNLAAIDLDLPLGQWIAITGPSGSGKTSLVFDTLVREGRARYLGALSPRARQFFGKLGRADVAALDGLPPAVAIGRADARASIASTVGTLTGVLDLLRLLFARTASDPAGVALTRSHFSFNHAVGQCAACRGSGVEDEVTEDLLVADATKSIREGALRPTLKNGYTVYSQVTLEVMDSICRAHGFDVHTPWRELTEAQRHVILFGTKALEVPFGKHPIESRMKWQGITARPREVGHYRGLIPVITETLARNRNPNVLRYARSVACKDCRGTRLGRPGREARLGPHTLPGLLGRTALALSAALDEVPPSSVLAAIAPELARRLEHLQQLGLGHLAFERGSATLSAGEAQRIRLAAQLAAPLSGLLIALDEPTLGLHPSGQAGMAAVLDALRAEGNTLAVVEHDPDMVRCADHLVALGPGAGPAGGRVTYDGPRPDEPLGAPPTAKARRRTARDTITLRGARLHNLTDANLTLHLGTLQVVMGPSGAGKTSLVFGTLVPALRGEPGGPYRSLAGGAATQTRLRTLDARPIGRTPRSTPATWSGLWDLVRARFAATAAAQARRLGSGHFSFNNAEGRCSTCEGLGTQRVGMHELEDLELVCPDCGGARFAPEVLAVTLRGASVAAVLAMSVADARAFFAADPPARALCQALDELGLGYLPLGFPSHKLSRGEAQRVRLATLLADPDAKPTVLVLDEPDRGLHPGDLDRLIGCLDRLIDAGHSVLAISHHRRLWAAADVHVEVCDGVAREVPPPGVAARENARAPRPAARPADQIALEGVRHHNLDGIDVALPRGALTALCGVSGSGKSSLAFDALAGEAWHRYAECLPFAVRRALSRMPRAELRAARGLGPVLALRQESAAAGPRSTVATQTEIGPLLRLLWSRAGRRDGVLCGLRAEHFSPDRAAGACPACAGRGVVSQCDPARLISHPDRALTDGAMAGSKVGRYLGEPDGQFLATLRAAASDVDWTQPWRTLSDAAQQLALRGGDGTTVTVRWAMATGKRGGEGDRPLEFAATWDGLLGLAEREAARRANQKAASQWAEPLVDVACPDCDGTRLGPAARCVTFGGLTLPAVLAQPLDRVLNALLSAGLDDHDAAVRAAVLPELEARVTELLGLGLGHLTLHRSTVTLSTGELQRCRLASVLRAGLVGVTVVLDEPTRGLHARDVNGLLARLRELRDAGNTIVVIEHEPAVLRDADHLIELGPGSGADGGRVVATGPPVEVLAGTSTTALALQGTAAPADQPSAVVTATTTLRGCDAHNLQSIDVTLPPAGLVAVTGVSGSGKSTWMFDVLGASVAAGHPVGCAAIEGLPAFAEVRSARAASRRGTVLEALGLLPAMQKLFGAEAAGSGLPRAAFSFHSPAGQCKTCRGHGVERVAMDFVADLRLPCSSCAGRRYRDEVLAVRWNGLDVAAFLAESASDLAALLPRGALRNGCEALGTVGLGGVALGRDLVTLSGGERQRALLAVSIVAAPSPALYLLDEPATGLHEADLNGLAAVLRQLSARGDLVVIAEHRLSLITQADWVLDLGPESGSGGGRVVACGPPASLATGATAAALQAACRS
ncbi:MAG: AAA family ATPase [Planctomycetota bacterium]